MLLYKHKRWDLTAESVQLLYRVSFTLSSESSGCLFCAVLCSLTSIKIQDKRKLRLLININRTVHYSVTVTWDNTDWGVQRGSRASSARHRFQSSVLGKRSRAAPTWTCTSVQQLDQITQNRWESEIQINELTTRRSQGSNEQMKSRGHYGGKLDFYSEWQF